MSTLIHRDDVSFLNDLVGWFSDVRVRPTVRVEEFLEDGQHVVRADLPGIDPETDVEVVVDNGLLRIHGQRREEKHEEHRSEIAYGSFDRVLRLPEGVSGDEVTADYTDGVLTVSLPAPAEPQKSRKIPIARRELPVE
ncbi:Hsp20/alpha crystallin family protein [Nocardioides rubriscoriae]|uniref:Hsp20/alpha crystallin family protein n=1 Tax=Nocardioides rubriscoriae TaxID=642762 RepID=UPI0014797E68|nr:Hsp20 family protein [Nocardioides rubriscoriae]